MGSWGQVIKDTIVQGGKRIVIRKPLRKADGSTYSNGRHEYWYIAKSDVDRVARQDGTTEYPGEANELPGRPKTLKLVTKREKNSHNNLQNNKKDKWVLVHDASSTEAVVLTPVQGELDGAADISELANLLSVIGPLSAAIPGAQRAVTEFFKPQRPAAPEPATSPQRGVTPSPATSASVTQPKGADYTRPKTLAITPYDPTTDTAPLSPRVTLQTDPEQVNNTPPVEVHHSADSTFGEAPTEDHTGGPTRPTQNTNNALEELAALLSPQTPAPAQGPVKREAKPEVRASTLLDPRVQTLGRLEAQNEAIRRAMMNHVALIGDGTPPVMPIAKPIICPSVARVADEELIYTLNMIMYDCAQKCSEALVHAEDRALLNLQAEIQAVCQGWNPNPEEREAIRQIKQTRNGRVKPFQPKRVNKVEFYRLPGEGDTAIPSCQAHKANESGAKIPSPEKTPKAKRKLNTTPQSKEQTKNNRPPNTPKTPVKKQHKVEQTPKKGQKNNNNTPKPTTPKTPRKDTTNKNEKKGQEAKTPPTTPKTHNKAPKKPPQTPKKSPKAPKNVQGPRQRHTPHGTNQQGGPPGYTRPPQYQGNQYFPRETWQEPHWANPRPNMYAGPTYNPPRTPYNGQRLGYRQWTPRNGYQSGHQSAPVYGKPYSQRF